MDEKDLQQKEGQTTGIKCWGCGTLLTLSTRRLHTIDTEMKAKRDNIISELIAFRSTKARAKENRGGGGR